MPWNITASVICRLKLLRNTFVQRDYRRVESDVVLTAPLRTRQGQPKRTVLIYILIEHQTRPDRLMPLRLLDYQVQIFKYQVRRWSEQHRSMARIRLKPVVPVVFYTEDKLVILDVLARDAEGRRFNIEMQTSIPSALPQRLAFYNCLNYVRQISQGDGYGQLRPAISICVLGRELFPGIAPYHLSFRLRCDQADLVLVNDLEFHTLELPKFTPSSDNVSELPAVEKWLYLMQHAPEMEAQDLADLLGDDVLREAIGVLEMISKSPEDQQFYEARLKFLRDQEALRLDQEANLQAARQEGIEEGRESGLLIGKILLLQELLGVDLSPPAELDSESIDGLTRRLVRLEAQLRERNN